MRLLASVAVVLGAALWLGGCGSSAPRGKSVATMTKAEIEAEVGRQLDLQSLTLTEGEKDRFTGTGMSADGKTYQVKATRNGNELAWEKSYKSPDGKISETAGGVVSP
ncbi:MAG TPA: hypothetical protein VGZ22_31295 [Isosphaeraceae bacterium]|jgi:hypothetical protein|nr:hypothetical protein [Isosphaeraceae bacterium]